MIQESDLLTVNSKGIYCPKGDFYIDPWQPVERAIITHAHADHARWGNKYYLAHHHSEPILRMRLGADINLQTLAYGEKLFLNGVQVSLHPAGHILGSAQVRLEADGLVVVASGDYKTQADALCTPFEPVKCDIFITESTFGLPIFHWESDAQIFQAINQWWRNNQSEGKTSVLFGYALGKAQRLLQGIDPQIGPVFVHGAIWNTLEVFKPIHQLHYPVTLVSQSIPKENYRGSLVVAPPGAFGSSWMRKFQPYVTAIASGWMNVRGMRRRRAMDTGFVLSDHADWNGLIDAVLATEAEKIYVTHGYSDIFSRYLRETYSLEAQVLETEYQGEVEEPAEEKPNAS